VTFDRRAMKILYHHRTASKDGHYSAMPALKISYHENNLGGQI